MSCKFQVSADNVLLQSKAGQAEACVKVMLLQRHDVTAQAESRKRHPVLPACRLAQTSTASDAC